MNERLLQFIWQHRYFDTSGLCTVSGAPVELVATGQLNTNQGPDFLNARIKIQELVLAGSIELHIRTSHWKQHGHDNDPHYNNVILHVVWEHDAPFEKPVEVLELKGRVAGSLLQWYAELMQTPLQIPCCNRLHELPGLVWQSWIDRMAAERLLQQQSRIQALLTSSKYSWETVFWQLLARNFGLPVNADVFEAVATTLPITLLAKHKNQVQQLEALLLGQANLLHESFTDPYALLLQREYRFLRSKYNLPTVHQQVQSLRMRPSSFPWIRLAQLAMLVHQSHHLFSKVVEAKELKDIVAMLQLEPNDYWMYHYSLTDAPTLRKKSLGKMMIHNLLINTIIPVLYVYGHEKQLKELQQKAIGWLQQLPAEHNRITRLWNSAGVGNESAFDSQALLYLYRYWCAEKKCLSCAAGTALLKRSTATS